MTKEQIKQNAEKYADENDICICDEEYWSHDDLVKAHIAGAESRQPEIDRAMEILAEFIHQYNTSMPFYSNIVVWKAEKFLEEHDARVRLPEKTENKNQ
ncbi:MAG: hypothetical protein IKS48_10405 [Eubacterium sp.]|nr:hypothetical protein [Eubacterium sp.]